MNVRVSILALCLVVGAAACAWPPRGSVPPVPVEPVAQGAAQTGDAVGETVGGVTQTTNDAIRGVGQTTGGSLGSIGGGSLGGGSLGGGLLRR